jgi:hypothetical protein
MAAPLVGAAALAAAKLVARKMAKDAAKKSVKKAIKTAKKTKPLAEPKSAVRVKPAAKPIGNPPNNAKAWESVLSSVSRGGVGRTVGKARDARVANAGKPKVNKPKARKMNQSEIKKFESNIDKLVSKEKMSRAKLEEVPSGVSARFAATNARLAKEAAKKKKSK